MTSRYEGRDLEAMAYARRYSQWVRDEFREYLRGDLCEVGAGNGNFTELLGVESVRSVTAVEPSIEMFPLLQQRFVGNARVQPVHGTLAQLPQEARFDTFVYNNVLEHVADDVGELESARRRLTKGGAICIFVPALPWLMSDFDRSIGHVRRYRKRELREKLVASGFEVVRLRYFDAPGILPWLVSMRWLRGGLDARKVKLYDRFVVPPVRLIETLIRPPIGRNLLAIGRVP